MKVPENKELVRDFFTNIIGRWNGRCWRTRCRRPLRRWRYCSKIHWVRIQVSGALGEKWERNWDNEIRVGKRSSELGKRIGVQLTEVVARWIRKREFIKQSLILTVERKIRVAALELRIRKTSKSGRYQ